MRQARQAVDEQRRLWLEQLASSRTDFQRQLRRQSGTALTELNRQLLADLAGTPLEDAILNQLIERLAGLESAERERLTPRDGTPLQILSAFELSRDQQERLGAAVKHQLGSDIELRFDLDADLMAGPGTGRRWRAPGLESARRARRPGASPRSIA